VEEEVSDACMVEPMLRQMRSCPQLLKFESGEKDISTVSLLLIVMMGVAEIPICGLG
jgi:hypothetical protein